LEVHPAEAAADIVNQSRAWGVVPCICRQQKALIGEPCGHPLEVCLVLSLTAGAFDRAEGIRALSREEALGVLATAADAGLVHTVSNSRRGLDYICSCCTCSCGILRGMAELGRANVVARSAFVNRVDPSLCTACGACAERCSFSALQVGAVAEVDGARCTGCGVCLAACQQGALSLARRPDGEVLPLPETKEEWGRERLLARGLA
jgi:ferredoxin